MSRATHPDDRMTKRQALALLGGNQADIAQKIGITQQAISRWPDVLSDKVRDRIHAVLWREHVQQLQREQRNRQQPQHV